MVESEELAKHEVEEPGELAEKVLVRQDVLVPGVGMSILAPRRRGQSSPLGQLPW